MQIAILINDSEYREALVERLSCYDNDLLVNVINGTTSFNKDSLILTDIDPNNLEQDILCRLRPRTIFLTAAFSPGTGDADCHRVFKYKSVSDLLSEASLVYKDWRGIGYGRDHSAKIIAVCFENDSVSYDKCMSLARQIVYRRGDRVLVLGLSYINDYGCEDTGDVNRFARLMYSISTGRQDAAYGHTYIDSYGISALMLKRGKNPLAYLDEDELMRLITSMAASFDTVILDIGTCYRKQNLILSENSDNIVLFEVGRRLVDLENLLCEDAATKVIRVKQSSDTEEAMALDDLINQIYGNNGEEVYKSASDH